MKLIDDLEEKAKKLEEEISLYKNEISRLNEENECLKARKSICDVSCGTEDLNSCIDKCVFAEDICDKNCQKDNVVRCNGNEKNVGLKIMERMGYKGQGLGKYGQGMREPIKPIMRPKHEGLVYVAGKGSNTVVTKFVKEMECVQCCHCNRKGHAKDTCWDLHLCIICGLRNHLEKMCWQKEKTNTRSMQMNCGWYYRSSWQKMKGMFKNLFKWKCSYVEDERNQERFDGKLQIASLQRRLPV